MDNRFKVWLAISLALFIFNFWIQATFFPPKPKPDADKAKVAVKAEEGAAKKEGDKADDPAAKDLPAEKPADEPKVGATEEPGDDAEKPAPVKVDPQWISLGSADPTSPYRMLVTLTNLGAAVERIELNSPRYRDLDDRSGYLGHMALEDVPKMGGAKVRAVGKATPADVAGIKVGDTIIGLDKVAISTGQQLDALLEKTVPGGEVTVKVERDGEQQSLKAKLVRRPLEIVRPERATVPLNFVASGKHDPYSMLLTLQTLDDKSLTAPEAGGVGKELAGFDLWSGAWEVIESDQESVSFRKTLAESGLELTKRFRLAASKAAEREDDPSYHLKVEVSIRNTGGKQRTVAYQLDGPTGLPAEGAWYSTKISRNWGAAGLRDIVVRFNGRGPAEVNTATIAENKATPYLDTPLNYIAVDAQYFAAALIPQQKRSDDLWFTDVRPIRVGELPKEAADHKLTNVSFRLTSVPKVLAPEEGLSHEFILFAGPKRPSILSSYQAQPYNESAPVTLDDLVYYGWFGWVAKPMLAILHAFYYVVRNYGLAIVMLTVMVRGLMFPISRKQAVSAQKMQELQPQIKALTEKYKNNPQERQKAQMELFRKHSYNPLAGCLPMFLQLPIFVGLYRSLMVDVELRDAPLISESVRWASNLAAPDMLLYWGNIMPEFVNKGQGFFGLGPYFNIFPIFTIILFLWQQKMFMPPPTDEQTAMQQKMMKYMMIFMGFMFFKVASGLCLYFIASSLWGIGERKLLPKTLPSSGVITASDKKNAIDVIPSTNGGTGKGKKKSRS